jgi:hypothetical protein
MESRWLDDRFYTQTTDEPMRSLRKTPASGLVAENGKRQRWMWRRHRANQHVIAVLVAMHPGLSAPTTSALCLAMTELNQRGSHIGSADWTLPERRLRNATKSLLLRLPSETLLSIVREIRAHGVHELYSSLQGQDALTRTRDQMWWIDISGVCYELRKLVHSSQTLWECVNFDWHIEIIRLCLLRAQDQPLLICYKNPGVTPELHALASAAFSQVQHLHLAESRSAGIHDIDIRQRLKSLRYESASGCDVASEILSPHGETLETLTVHGVTMTTVPLPPIDKLTHLNLSGIHPGIHLEELAEFIVNCPSLQTVHVSSVALEALLSHPSRRRAGAANLKFLLIRGSYRWVAALLDLLPDPHTTLVVDVEARRGYAANPSPEGLLLRVLHVATINGHDLEASISRIGFDRPVESADLWHYHLRIRIRDNGSLLCHCTCTLAQLTEITLLGVRHIHLQSGDVEVIMSRNPSPAFLVGMNHLVVDKSHNRDEPQDALCLYLDHRAAAGLKLASLRFRIAKRDRQIASIVHELEERRLVDQVDSVLWRPS